MQTTHKGMDRLKENQKGMLKQAGAGYLGEPLQGKVREGYLESRKLLERKQEWR